MYNFYNLNPELTQSSSKSTNNISLDVNEALNNETFYKLFEAYYYDQSLENETLLGEHLNHIDYLIGFISGDPEVDIAQLKSITIHSMDDLNLLICTTEEREVFLPVFTDTKELHTWATEPVFTLTVPAKWLWQFALNQKNISGIVFNPGTIGWDISLEHISSLLEDIK